MDGSPKVRRNWISSALESMQQGKIIAWDFADRGLPLTAASGRGLRLLASRQIGMKPTADGNPNGTAGGGEMYGFENQKCAAPLDPMGASGRDAAPDRLPARSRAIWLALLLANPLSTRSRQTCASIPFSFGMRYLGTNKRGAEALIAATKAGPLAGAAFAWARRQGIKG